MKTVFRIDDVTAYMPGVSFDSSSAEGQGCGGRFGQVLSMLLSAGAPPLLGIVPDLRDEVLSPDIPENKDERDSRFLRFVGLVRKFQDQGCEIAMHGLRHLYTTLSAGIFPLNSFSEFAGVPSDEQGRRIAEGKRILREAGLNTEIFMAPGHTFDKETLKALRNNGFTGVTDGFGVWPYLREGLTFYPIAFNTEKDARSGRDGWTTVVLHPCTMSDEGVERLSQMLHDPEVHPAPYSEFLKQKPVNSTAFSIAREYSMATFKRTYVKLRGNAGEPGKHIGERYMEKGEHPPIRVLNVLGGTDLGGAESRIMDLFRHIDRERVIFDFLVHMDPSEYRRALADGRKPLECRKKQHFDDEIERLGGRIYAVPRLTSGTYSLYVRSLRDFFRDNKDHIDVLEGHMTSTASIYMRIAKEYGIHPIICHARSAGTGSGMKGCIKRVFRRGAYKYADYLFTCSEKARTAVFGDRDAVFIPNAIETERFSFSQENREAVREEYGLKGKRVVGHIGRFSYPKNHSFLLRVFAEMVRKNEAALDSGGVQAENSGLSLLLVGGGELFDEVKKEASDLGLGDRVIFAGERSDPERYYSAMDLLIFPSRYEGMPGTIVEAQANGLPCLVSDAVSKETAVCDLVEFISLEDGEKAWAERGVSLLLDTQEADRVSRSRAGRKALITSCYDAEALGKRLTEFYTGKAEVFN